MPLPVREASVMMVALGMEELKGDSTMNLFGLDHQGRKVRTPEETVILELM